MGRSWKNCWDRESLHFGPFSISFLAILAVVCRYTSAQGLEQTTSRDPQQSIEISPRVAEPEMATPVAPQDPLSFSNERLKLKFGIGGVLQSNGVLGSWWNLSEQYAPDAGYNPDRVWGESWLKPSMNAELSIDPSVAVYSGLSYVGSGNIGRDVFEQGNRGMVAVEDAFLGARLGSSPEDWRLDVSYGRQAYKIGSGMLISVGAINGFERGATTAFARRAWEEAGLVKLNKGPVALEGFYLNPNELRSSDTFTRLAGAKLETALGPEQYLGFAAMNVFESEYPYVQAPIQLLPNGREGLNTIHTYGRWKPAADVLGGFYIAGDYAY